MGLTAVRGTRTTRGSSSTPAPRTSTPRRAGGPTGPLAATEQFRRRRVD